MSYNNANRRPQTPERICHNCGGWAKIYRTRKLKTRPGWKTLCLECTYCHHRWPHHTKDHKPRSSPYAKYPPSIREVLMTPDAELDELYGDPDAPRPTFVAWCREVWENRVYKP